MKYVAAISDADIMIHLAKADELDILRYLFTKIIIPQYVLEREIKRKAGTCLPVILRCIEAGTLFQVLDRQTDYVLNKLAEPIIEDKRAVVGRGESECAGYAAALGIGIIISDNCNEFKWLSENVMLTYYDILVLNVHFGYMDQETASNKYEKINAILGQSSGISFKRRQLKTFENIQENNWEVPLGLKD